VEYKGFLKKWINGKYSRRFMVEEEDGPKPEETVGFVDLSMIKTKQKRRKLRGQSWKSRLSEYAFFSK
jgi:hypothetical protein